jgi:hypothetical protein
MSLFAAPRYDVIVQCLDVLWLFHPETEAAWTWLEEQAQAVFAAEAVFDAEFGLCEVNARTGPALVAGLTEAGLRPMAYTKAGQLVPFPEPQGR